jgi:hypothetical protein
MIFIDRSVPRSIARALQLVRPDVYWLEDVWIFHKGTKESEWLPAVGQAGWLVVSRDKKILSRPAERQAITDGAVGAFIFTQKADPTKWEYLKMLARNLDDMERIFEEEQRPFIWKIQQGGNLKKAA